LRLIVINVGELITPLGCEVQRNETHRLQIDRLGVETLSRWMSSARRLFQGPYRLRIYQIRLEAGNCGINQPGLYHPDCCCDIIARIVEGIESPLSTVEPQNEFANWMNAAFAAGAELRLSFWGFSFSSGKQGDPHAEFDIQS
jgi:hypothetical protein